MPATPTPPDVDGLDGLDAVEVLAAVGEADLAERRAAPAKLELALRWCGLHPATTDTGTAVWGLPGLTDWDESLGGEGCPSVAGFAPEPFAAALGVSTRSGMQVLADALDLGHRLPATWRRLLRLEVPAWRARRLAQATHHLSQTAAAHVDGQLAGRLHSCGGVLIDRAVAQAAATHDPEVQAAREQTGRQAWKLSWSTPAAPVPSGSPPPPTCRPPATPQTWSRSAELGFPCQGLCARSPKVVGEAPGVTDPNCRCGVVT
ncbi:MAG: hypothetical protein J2P22_17760 [Nocardioides sp.]|nr:hypothetical protein [Nocardioides sp.]